MKKIATFIVALGILGASEMAISEEPHWGYGGEAGPERWGELAAAFDMCARGKNQSPIDLVADGRLDNPPELVFEYMNPGVVKESNTGHAIQLTVINPGNYFVIQGKRYELKQFHFHSPSEHLIAGRSFPMEVHLAHQSADGDLAVIGLLVDEGAENELINRLPSFRARRGENPYDDPVDYNDLIPSRTDYYVYNGSLTTPPCTEGVHWIVLKQPLIVSPEQIKHYHELLGFDNNRPVQPINARMIVE